jgi:hypothetical protein
MLHPLRSERPAGIWGTPSRGGGCNRYSRQECGILSYGPATAVPPWALRPDK